MLKFENISKETSSSLTEEEAIALLKIEEIDPDEFKKKLYESPKESDENPIAWNPFLPLNFNSLSLQETPEQIVTSIVYELLEEIEKITSLESGGIIESSFFISKPGSLLDQTEIIIQNFDFAPKELNVEIKTCDKLLCLLQKHQEVFFEKMSSMKSQFTIKRLDLSILKKESKKRSKYSAFNPIKECQN